MSWIKFGGRLNHPEADIVDVALRTPELQRAGSQGSPGIRQALG
ncbi:MULTISPECIES: hypothetical protein [Paracoccus]|nr:hypothetical protein [Paracoccus beibuensis]